MSFGRRTPFDQPFRPPRLDRHAPPRELAPLALLEVVEATQEPTVEGSRLRWQEATTRALVLAARPPDPADSPRRWCTWARALAALADELEAAGDQMMAAVAAQAPADGRALDAAECPDTVGPTRGEPEPKTSPLAK